jgi:gliding motility-associated lipoprotein GldH
MPSIKIRWGYDMVISFICCILIFSSCQSINLYEKDVAIPHHAWQGAFKPSFKFNINDTTSSYQVFITLRHNDQYDFNNIWINLYIKAPGDSVKKVQYELPLATNERGWMGTAMDDLYEHRIALTPQNERFYFKKPGEYTFTIEQIMREDPLNHIMNVGLRIEKKPQ